MRSSGLKKKRRAAAPMARAMYEESAMV